MTFPHFFEATVHVYTDVVRCWLSKPFVLVKILKLTTVSSSFEFQQLLFDGLTDQYCHSYDPTIIISHNVPFIGEQMCSFFYISGFHINCTACWNSLNFSADNSRTRVTQIFLLWRWDKYDKMQRFSKFSKKNIRKFRRSFRAISNVWKFLKDGFGSLPLYKLFKNASHWADHNSTINSSSHQVLSRVKSAINEIQRCYLTSSNVAVVTAMCDIIPIFMI